MYAKIKPGDALIRHYDYIVGDTSAVSHAQLCTGVFLVYGEDGLIDPDQSMVSFTDISAPHNSILLTTGEYTAWTNDETQKSNLMTFRYMTDTGFVIPVTLNRWRNEDCRHDFLKKVEAVEPACEEAGSIEYYECSGCGLKFADANAAQVLENDAWILPPVGHSAEHYPAVEPAVMKEGSVEYWQCAVCGKCFADEACTEEIAEIIIPAIPEFGQWSIVRIPLNDGTYTDFLVIDAEHTCSSLGVSSMQCEKDDGMFLIFRDFITKARYYNSFEDMGSWEQSAIREICMSYSEMLPAEFRRLVLDTTITVPGGTDTAKVYILNAAEIKAALPTEKIKETTTGSWWRRLESSSQGLPYANKAGTPMLLAETQSNLNNARYGVRPVLNLDVTAEDLVYNTKAGVFELTEISPAEHTMIYHAAADASCTAEGNTAYCECTECGKYFRDPDGIEEIPADSWLIPAKGHEVEYHPGVPAACTEPGTAEYYECTECGRYFNDADGIEEIPDDSWLIPAKGHEVEYHPGVPAACTEPGAAEYYECTECGRHFSDADGIEEIPADSWLIPAKGHEVEYHPGVPATCTEPGTAEYYECTECGRLYSDAGCRHEITAADLLLSAGHDPEYHPYKAAKNNKEGNVEYWKCLICGRNFADEECTAELETVVIPAKKNTPPGQQKKNK